MIYLFNILFYLSFSIVAQGQVLPSVTTDNAEYDKLDEFCTRVNGSFKKYRWNKIICNPKRWKYEKISTQGDPLIYQTFFANPNSKKNTFIFCGIHGDELPSTYLCIHLVRDIIFDNPELYKNSNIIIAPLVNPDSFFFKKPSRLNANGVDLNRNFPTKDWDRLALHLWKNHYSSAKRRYPGPEAASEVETQFVVDIIKRFNPERIISVHGPYGFWDYDYLGSKTEWKKVKRTAHKLGKMSRNFPVKDFRVFPGSLGNYAGSDLQIPTYTLELNSVRSQDSHYLWMRFRNSLRYILTK